MPLHLRVLAQAAQCDDGQVDRPGAVAVAQHLIPEADNVCGLQLIQTERPVGFGPARQRRPVFRQGGRAHSVLVGESFPVPEIVGDVVGQRRHPAQDRQIIVVSLRAELFQGGARVAESRQLASVGIGQRNPTWTARCLRSRRS